MENPIKMDDLEVPLFSETPIWKQQKQKLVLYDVRPVFFSNKEM